MRRNPCASSTQSADAEQDQQLGEAREAVDDEGAVEGASPVGQHHRRAAPATDQQRRSPAIETSALALCSPRDRADQQQHHRADREDQLGQKDAEVGLRCSPAASVRDARRALRRAVIGERRLVLVDQIGDGGRGHVEHRLGIDAHAGW